MLVFVAVQAARKFDFIKCFFTSRYVALRTWYGRVLRFERISGAAMFFQSEFCRLESVHCVAGGAFSTIGAFQKLALVLITMAIRAALECKWFLEIASFVTLDAFNGLVLPNERILGFGMVEALVEGARRDSLPATRVVARLAALLGKTSPVRIAVAVGTFGK